MTLSCSNLLKQSAMQHRFLLLNPSKKPQITPNIIKGTQAQAENSTSKYKEMRGAYTIEDDCIFYCIDEVQVHGSDLLCIEHKNTRENYPDWEFQIAQVQACLYTALADNCQKLSTATFYRNLGNQSYTLERENYINLIPKLLFNNTMYTLESDTSELIQFYTKKARAVLTSYDTAKAWDAKFKFKEAAILSQHITCIKDQQ